MGVFRWAPAFFFLLPPSLSAGDDPFELRWIPVHGRRQDTVINDFDGDGLLDILTSAIDYDVDPPVRWLFIWRQRKPNEFGDRPEAILEVDDRTWALCFGDVLPGGGVEICFLAPDGVYAYPFLEGAIQEKPLKILHLPTFVSQSSRTTLPIWSFTEDLDGDGRHDLIVPVSDGYRICFQTAPGLFGAIVRLEADLPQELRADRAIETDRFAHTSEVQSYAFTLSNLLPRLEPVDVDGDGRRDLVNLKGDTFTIFFQKKPRSFSAADRRRSVVALLEKEARKNTIDLSHVLLTDLDGDRRADLVITRIVGQVGLLESLQTEIVIHRGKGRGNFVADRVIKVGGLSDYPAFMDMDGNGTKDVFLAKVDTTLVKKAVDAGIFGDLSLDYEVFEFVGGRELYEGPVYARAIRVPIRELEKKSLSGVPLASVPGDLSGDGRPDLLILQPTNEVEIYRGRVHYKAGGAPTIGFERDVYAPVAIDHHPKWVSTYDINGDGTEDVLLHYAGSVGVMLSRKR